MSNKTLKIDQKFPITVIFSNKKTKGFNNWKNARKWAQSKVDSDDSLNFAIFITKDLYKYEDEIKELIND